MKPSFDFWQIIKRAYRKGIENLGIEALGCQIRVINVTDVIFGGLQPIGQQAYHPCHKKCQTSEHLNAFMCTFHVLS